MKTKNIGSGSIVTKVAGILRAEKEQERAQRELGLKLENDRRSRLEKSMGRIIPELLTLVSSDEGVKELLSDQSYICNLRYSALAECYNEQYDDVSKEIHKQLMAKKTPAEREAWKKDVERRKREIKELALKHKPLLDLFKPKLKEMKFLNESSGGVGIILASSMHTEKRIGRMSRKEYDKEIFSHVVLVLRNGKLEISAFEPDSDPAGGRYWGNPLSPENIHPVLVDHIHNLANGGITAVETIMRTRIREE